MAQTLGSDSFEDTLKKCPFTCVFFKMEGCPYCIQYAPFFDSVAAKYSPHIQFIIVDSKNPITGTYNVHAFPTTGFFKGQECKELVGGAQSEEQLCECIERIFPRQESLSGGLFVATKTMPDEKNLEKYDWTSDTVVQILAFIYPEKILTGFLSQY